MTRLAASLVLLFVTTAASGQTVRVHDPAVAREGEFYYVFSTHDGIRVQRSRDLRTWERLDNVFAELPAWTKQTVPGVRGLWAPDVCYFNGRYHLYYSVSTFGSRRSCVGLATNESLDPKDPRFKWVDHGKVIESAADGDWNAIDPNVVLDEKGTPWMSLGSFWTGIKLVKLDAKTGLRAADDAKLYSIARRPREGAGGAVEAPYIIRRDGFYYLFVSFDYCCRGVRSTYNIRVGRSREVTGPYVDRDGRPMLDGGGTLVLEGAGDVRGPGHCSVLLGDAKGDLLVHHFYDAADNGRAKLQVRKLTWDEAGWPRAGDVISQ